MRFALTGTLAAVATTIMALPISAPARINCGFFPPTTAVGQLCAQIQSEEDDRDLAAPGNALVRHEEQETRDQREAMLLTNIEDEIRSERQRAIAAESNAEYEITALGKQLDADRELILKLETELGALRPHPSLDKPCPPNPPGAYGPC